jgi:hypothetical protein
MRLAKCITFRCLMNHVVHVTTTKSTVSGTQLHGNNEKLNCCEFTTKHAKICISLTDLEKPKTLGLPMETYWIWQLIADHYVSYIPVIQKHTQQFTTLQFFDFVHHPVFKDTKQKKLATAFWRQTPSLSSGRKVGDRNSEI